MLHMHDMTILEQFMGECCPIFFLIRQINKAEVFVYNDEEPLDKTNTKQKNIYTSWFPSGKFAITQPILDHLSEKCCPAFNSFIYVIVEPKIASSYAIAPSEVGMSGQICQVV